MNYVGNTKLEKITNEMLAKLLVGESFGPIEFRLVEGVYFLGTTWIKGRNHRIVINHKIGRMIKSRRGLARVYAVLAHEVGHVMHINELVTIPTTEEDFTTEFRVLAEKEADRRALRLLAKVYPNPKEIILEQIAYAHKISLKYAKEKEYRDLADIFAYGRGEGLNTDTTAEAPPIEPAQSDTESTAATAF